MQRDALIDKTVKDLRELRQRLKMDMPEEYERFCRIISGDDSILSDCNSPSSHYDAVDRGHMIETIIKYVEISGTDQKSLHILKERLQRLKH